jgi:hypothetical protein
MTVTVDADDLDTADAVIPDLSIGGMRHGKPARCPFVHIAGQDRQHLLLLGLKGRSAWQSEPLPRPRHHRPENSAPGSATRNRHRAELAE